MSKTDEKRTDQPVSPSDGLTALQTFFEGINGFTDDFMENGRDEFIPSEREEL